MTDEQVEAWIAADPDPRTRTELQELDPESLAERFSDTLHFGTAGLRGPVRAGPAGMNVAVVSGATAGVGQWLIDHGHRGSSVVVGRDARHGSEDFFAATTQVLAAQGFDVIALPEPGPTPLVAFAVRDLGAAAGIQITASHNPPADNGYKVYLGEGAQLVPPADAEIEQLITMVGPAKDIPRVAVGADSRARANVDRYLARLVTRFGSRERRRIRVALTAMHGVGGDIAVQALRECGFHDVTVVGLQHSPDPDFPTAAFPNPEEPGASDLLLDLARDSGADLAIALDPDADRCAVGAYVDGAWRMLTGDETGALLGAEILDEHRGENALVASTIVSGTLLGKIAAASGARHATTLTGFKWLVRAGDGLVYAYEEAIGHCVDPEAVRDKDGISAAIALCVLAERLAGQEKGLGDRLDDLFTQFGVHATGQYSLRVDDLSRITDVMDALRTHPPADMAGSAVTAEDFLDRPGPRATDAVQFTGSTEHEQLRVIARPSGTEPKLKFYLEVAVAPGAPLEQAKATAHARLKQLTAQVAEFSTSVGR
ncbi:phospho-sugar mutase [Williamsia sp. 1135]|uniref:phospho-sugar mutase n=1 Tax=Williamsia sp. 1135 TaxID=1889262 RepID=UPI000A1189C5|nr:phospho-sugar mutase [Williamsia sp. 1135]ORM25951.1 phosphomannomutase [Williamsia sp. 1135]